LGRHGFTLGLPLVFRTGLDQLALSPLFPALVPPRTRGFVGLMVQAASRAGQMGCAAVEGLICAVTMAGGCAGNVEPACTAGLDAIAAGLDAGLQPTAGYDLWL